MEQTLGQRIAEARKARGLTQEALATELSVSPQAVSKWENDLTCPDISLLPKLAELLGLSVDELLSGKSKAASLRLVPDSERKSVDELMLKITVDSRDGDKIRINLPVALLKVAVEMGMALPQFSAKESLGKLDFEKILELAERGVLGELMEVESADGDIIHILVE